MAGGRPTVLTPDVVSKLEEVLKDGGTITEACEQAGISRDTYHRNVNDDSKFSDKMAKAQEYVTEVAKSVVARDITKRKNTETAKWWLERKRKSEFSTRVEQNITVSALEEAIKEADQFVK